MTVALLTSLLLAVTWTPALSLVFLRARRSEGETNHDEHRRMMSAVLRWHERGLSWSLGRPFVLLGICALLAVGSFFCYRGLGSDLLPEMDEGESLFSTTLCRLAVRFPKRTGFWNI